LFDESQKDVFRIDLVVTVALDDLGGSLGSLLRSFGKAIKSHHIEVPPPGDTPAGQTVQIITKASRRNISTT
jgi:hypothetical protein